ncbi:MAG TPA: hypothetical protein VFI24_12865 [Pyrinomonadaceae bacterium]|nr:hypothetical protein [Pyrinomonadaceae bacterium]
MASHSSATVREHTPRIINAVTNKTLNQTQMSDVLRRRAESVVNDKSIDNGSRAIIRYALEINDPILSELVLRVEDGECIVDNITAADDSENDSPEQKVEALAEMICQGDDQGTRAAALLVLLAAVETAADPKSLAKTAKHSVFTRCGEMNVYGMVDVQIAMLERELFTNNSRLS